MPYARSFTNLLLAALLAMLAATALGVAAPAWRNLPPAPLAPPQREGGSLPGLPMEHPPANMAPQGAVPA